MKLKITALALGLFLLVPGAFAQYGGGGTQTFTVPRLTVNPGPLTVAGTFSITGDFELGSGAVLLLDDGTELLPSMAFSSEPTTGIFREAAGEINFTLLADEAFEMRGNGTTLTQFSFEAQVVGESMFKIYEGPTDYEVSIADYNSGGNTFVARARADQMQMILGSASDVMEMTIMGPAAGSYIRFDPGFSTTDYTEIVVDTPSGTNTATLPALSGTVILSGATNVETGTTTIASDTGLNLHSTLAVTIDGDSDNNNTGAVTLTNDNDTQQILLTTTGVSALSDAGVTLQVDDGASGVSRLEMTNVGAELRAEDGTGDIVLNMDGTAYTGSLQGFDGTDAAGVTVDESSVTVDGDIIGAGTGTVTLQTDGTAAQVVLSDTSVDINHDTDITLDADDTTNNASLTLDGDGNAATLSVSDGTDTADIRLGQTSVTIDGDVDDDADGTVTLTAANSTSQVVVDSTGVSVTNYLFLDSVAFAALGTPANGALIYCTNCDPTSNPCTTGGASTGAMASRVAAAWICN